VPTLASHHELNLVRLCLVCVESDNDQPWDYRSEPLVAIWLVGKTLAMDSATRGFFVTLSQRHIIPDYLITYRIRQSPTAAVTSVISMYHTTKHDTPTAALMRFEWTTCLCYDVRVGMAVLLYSVSSKPSQLCSDDGRDARIHLFSTRWDQIDPYYSSRATM
jgi:hypothetical protein